jgi:cleavage and polyadenylation specificity factor subunit 1
MQTAFDHAKRLLASAAPLHHPHPHATLSLADTHVGAVLQQKTGGCWQPLAFFSHKLSPTEGRYSTFDRELLAAFQAVKHFRFFLEGRPFTLFTDHKPLVAAISKNRTPFSSRQQRHLSFLSEFTTNFVHLPGKENIVFPARPPCRPLTSHPHPPCQLTPQRLFLSFPYLSPISPSPKLRPHAHPSLT